MLKRRLSLVAGDREQATPCFRVPSIVASLKLKTVQCAVRVRGAEYAPDIALLETLLALETHCLLHQPLVCDVGEQSVLTVRSGAAFLPEVKIVAICWTWLPSQVPRRNLGNDLLALRRQYPTCKLDSFETPID